MKHHNHMNAVRAGIPHENLKYIGPDAAHLLAAFGLSTHSRRTIGKDIAADDLNLDDPGIFAIVGPSGCGKSSILKSWIESHNIDQPTGVESFDATEIILQTLGNNIGHAARTLAAFGLADAAAWSRIPGQLSDGQRRRFEAAVQFEQSGRLMTIDDFAVGLDTLTAQGYAATVAREARRREKTLIIATPHHEILHDLDPDAVLTMQSNGDAHLDFRYAGRTTPALATRIEYKIGTWEDWQALSPLHYQPGNPTAIAAIRIARDRHNQQLAGVAVWSLPTPKSGPRNIATNGKYATGTQTDQIKALNRDGLCLSRIVVAPEYRGLSISKHLIEITASENPHKWLECSAMMAAHSPFLAKSGFTEYTTETPADQDKLETMVDNLQIPPIALLDGHALREHLDTCSHRVRRRARSMIWLHYHHNYLHRRTRAKRPSRVPNPGDSRWHLAFAHAVTRLRTRPSYWFRPAQIETY